VISAEAIHAISKKFKTLRTELDERGRRIWAATEATALGYGGVAAVARATEMATSTIHIGIAEVRAGRRRGRPAGERRVRRAGGGRKTLAEQDPELVPALDRLLDPATRGDPQSPLRWTSKSTRKLADELSRQGHSVDHVTIHRLLGAMGYSLQAPRKTVEGKQHPDRDAQFCHISESVRGFQLRALPVISVDSKKKENIGDFANKGREYHPAGEPPRVRVHDFIDKDLGKAIPFGVYDLTRNNGWVSVGIDHDTSEFAAATILQWWRRMGSRAYPDASELLITADGGGSNSSRTRLWKVGLQRLADATGLTITVCHFPPGTSKWNKIEHRMFCHITENWRGRPLVDRATVVSLIANTTTKRGLSIRADLDETNYPTGIRVTDDEFATLNIERNAFHGEWNYRVAPGNTKS